MQSDNHLLAKQEENHWWFKSLHYFTISEIRKINKKDLKILDAGCGTGGLIKKIQEAGFNDVSGFDLTQESIDFCLEKSLNVKKVDLLECNKHYESNYFDVIVSNDTLGLFEEEDRLKIIKNLHELLTEDGVLIMNFAAIKQLKGNHDLQHNLKIRFTKKEIVRITSSLLQLKKSFYWSMITAIPIFIHRKLQNIFNSKPSSDLKYNFSFLNSLIFVIIQFEKFVLVENSPVGSSLFCVFRKK